MISSGVAVRSVVTNARSLPLVLGYPQGPLTLISGNTSAAESSSPRVVRVACPSAVTRTTVRRQARKRDQVEELPRGCESALCRSKGRRRSSNGCPWVVAEGNAPLCCRTRSGTRSVSKDARHDVIALLQDTVRRDQRADADAGGARAPAVAGRRPGARRAAHQHRHQWRALRADPVRPCLH